MIVYLAKNDINGKCYVGKTVDLDRRKIKHKSDSLNHIQNGKFARAIRKYGFDKFSWTVLCECSNDAELNDKEKYFIEAFDCIRNGYNMTLGGEGGNTLINKKVKLDHQMKIKSALSKKQHSTSKTWYVYDENFSEFILTGREFIDFFESKNINVMTIRQIVYGRRRRKFHNGYTASLKKLPIQELKNSLMESRRYVPPEKKISWVFYKDEIKHNFRLREDFCRATGLTFGQARMITDYGREIDGWKGFKTVCTEAIRE